MHSERSAANRSVVSPAATPAATLAATLAATPAETPAETPTAITAAISAPSPAERRSPVDLAGRWARDQDAEMTIVYDTPTRREAPAKKQAKVSLKVNSTVNSVGPEVKVAVKDQPEESQAPSPLNPERDAIAADEKPKVNGIKVDLPVSPGQHPCALPEQRHRTLNGEVHAKRPNDPTVANLDEDSVDLFTPPRPGT